jgi:hypothetical protein
VEGRCIGIDQKERDIDILCFNNQETWSTLKPRIAQFTLQIASSSESSLFLGKCLSQVARSLRGMPIHQ